jgi:nucleotide-binding universal stress UspA family protein
LADLSQEVSVIRQVLVSLSTYPDRPSRQVMEGASLLAQFLGASLTAHIPQICGDPQTWPAVVGTFPLDFPQMMNEAVMQSEANAAALADEISKICSDFGIPLDMRRHLTTLLASTDALIDLGRLHDLTVLPAPQSDVLGSSALEAAIFGTGHPTLLLPSGKGKRPLQSLNRVVVAWDHSREAARAMADAMPILSKARDVHILSVLGEKGIRTTCVAGDLEKYLTAHKMNYVIDRITLKEGGIGDCVMSHAMDINADLLVMGAYGHSRLREFILGGATQAILADTRLPVLLSH